MAIFTFPFPAESCSLRALSQLFPQQYCAETFYIFYHEIHDYLALSLTLILSNVFAIFITSYLLHGRYKFNHILTK